jgi:hypothetical protein
MNGKLQKVEEKLEEKFGPEIVGPVESIVMAKINSWSVRVYDDVANVVVRLEDLERVLDEVAAGDLETFWREIGPELDDDAEDAEDEDAEDGTFPELEKALLWVDAEDAEDADK